LSVKINRLLLTIKLTKILLYINYTRIWYNKYYNIS